MVSKQLWAELGRSHWNSSVVSMQHSPCPQSKTPLPILQLDRQWVMPGQLPAASEAQQALTLVRQALFSVKLREAPGSLSEFTSQFLNCRAAQPGSGDQLGLSALQQLRSPFSGFFVLKSQSWEMGYSSGSQPVRRYPVGYLTSDILHVR